MCIFPFALFDFLFVKISVWLDNVCCCVNVYGLSLFGPLAFLAAVLHGTGGPGPLGNSLIGLTGQGASRLRGPVNLLLPAAEFQETASDSPDRRSRVAEAIGNTLPGRAAAMRLQATGEMLGGGGSLGQAKEGGRADQVADALPQGHQQMRKQQAALNDASQGAQPQARHDPSDRLQQNPHTIKHQQLVENVSATMQQQQQFHQAQQLAFTTPVPSSSEEVRAVDPFERLAAELLRHIKQQEEASQGSTGKAKPAASHVSASSTAIPDSVVFEMTRKDLEALTSRLSALKVLEGRVSSLPVDALSSSPLTAVGSVVPFDASASAPLSLLSSVSNTSRGLPIDMFSSAVEALPWTAASWLSTPLSQPAAGDAPVLFSDGAGLPFVGPEEIGVYLSVFAPWLLPLLQPSAAANGPPIVTEPSVSSALSSLLLPAAAEGGGVPEKLTNMFIASLEKMIKPKVVCLPVEAVPGPEGVAYIRYPASDEQMEQFESLQQQATLQGAAPYNFLFYIIDPRFEAFDLMQATQPRTSQENAHSTNTRRQNSAEWPSSSSATPGVFTPESYRAQSARLRDFAAVAAAATAVLAEVPQSASPSRLQVDRRTMFHTRGNEMNDPGWRSPAETAAIQFAEGIEQVDDQDQQLLDAQTSIARATDHLQRIRFASSKMANQKSPHQPLRETPPASSFSNTVDPSNTARTPEATRSLPTASSPSHLEDAIRGYYAAVESDLPVVYVHPPPSDGRVAIVAPGILRYECGDLLHPQILEFKVRVFDGTHISKKKCPAIIKCQQSQENRGVTVATAGNASVISVGPSSSEARRPQSPAVSFAAYPPNKAAHPPISFAAAKTSGTNSPRLLPASPASYHNPHSPSAASPYSTHAMALQRPRPASTIASSASSLPSASLKAQPSTSPSTLFTQQRRPGPATFNTIPVGSQFDAAPPAVSQPRPAASQPRPVASDSPSNWLNPSSSPSAEQDSIASPSTWLNSSAPSQSNTASSAEHSVRCRSLPRLVVPPRGNVPLSLFDDVFAVFSSSPPSMKIAGNGSPVTGIEVFAAETDSPLSTDIDGAIRPGRARRVFPAGRYGSNASATGVKSRAGVHRVTCGTAESRRVVDFTAVWKGQKVATCRAVVECRPAESPRIICRSPVVKALSVGLSGSVAGKPSASLDFSNVLDNKLFHVQLVPSAGDVSHVAAAALRSQTHAVPRQSNLPESVPYDQMHSEELAETIEDQDENYAQRLAASLTSAFPELPSGAVAIQGLPFRQAEKLTRSTADNTLLQPTLQQPHNTEHNDAKMQHLNGFASSNLLSGNEFADYEVQHAAPPSVSYNFAAIASRYSHAVEDGSNYDAQPPGPWDLASTFPSTNAPVPTNDFMPATMSETIQADSAQANGNLRAKSPPSSSSAPPTLILSSLYAPSVTIHDASSGSQFGDVANLSCAAAPGKRRMPVRFRVGVTLPTDSGRPIVKLAYCQAIVVCPNA
eukprot:GHVT01073513.1.p1 GENE.GHVT01073513.1~~GHVT01073513.1.p1  ORF type:complete len:1471 (+),score=296.90 GHVT01073513.1:73-4485(+)